MRKSYPSDISREQFEAIREELAGSKKRTHPRKYDLYDLFCAVLYLLKEGCTWRAIPHDFPKWQNVRYHYDIWSSPDENGVSVLDRVLRKLVEAEREKNGRIAQTTMLIVDSKLIPKAFKMLIPQKKRAMTRGKSIWNKTAYWSGHFRAAPYDHGDNCQCN